MIRQLRRSKLAAIVVALTMSMLLSAGGCMSFDRDGMFAVDVGSLSADVLILVLPTWRLGQVYDGTKGSASTKDKTVASVLRSGAGKLPSVVQDRWNAATASDQYSDLDEAMRGAKLYTRCLAVSMTLGWGDIGYNWHYHTGGGYPSCTIGVDPLKH